MLQEYDFEVVHRAGMTNIDVDGLSRNPSPLDEDLIGARWHGDCDREAVPSWHVVAYLTLFSGASIDIWIQGLDDEIYRPQATTDIWKDLLYCISFNMVSFLCLFRQ